MSIRATSLIKLNKKLKLYFVKKLYSTTLKSSHHQSHFLLCFWLFYLKKIYLYHFRPSAPRK